MNLSFPPHAPIFNETVTFEKGKVDIGSERQERMEVDDKERNHDEDEDDNQEQTTPTAFSFSFPPQKSPLPMTTANPSRTTPVRRRSGAPTSIPNFPSATEHREPPVHYSPSPSRSPAASSPYQSPAVTPMKLPSSRVPFMPIQSPPSAGQSPWHALAATSGAPTPSLDGPGAGKGKGSPHLGYPFENLNIGGSWSGANLWGEGAQGRRASLEPAVVPSMSAPPKSTSMSGAVHGGINKEALARYRAAMGKTAAKEVPHTMEVDPPPVPTKTPLPAALARRRGSLPKNAIAMANNSLSPSTTHPTKAPSPLASSTTPLVLAPNKIKPLAPSAIPPMLSKPATLILDLRPPSAHHGARLPDSHSLSVPSTLLRRPAFTTAKMTQMLSTVSSAAVGRWRETTDIILVDVDSSSASQGSIMDGVANKFASEGYRGCLWYIKGGFAAVVATPGIEIISDDGEEEDAADPKPVAMKLNASGMMVGRLDKLAFQQGMSLADPEVFHTDFVQRLQAAKDNRVPQAYVCPPPPACRWVKVQGDTRPRAGTSARILSLLLLQVIAKGRIPCQIYPYPGPTPRLPLQVAVPAIQRRRTLVRAQYDYNLPTRSSTISGRIWNCLMVASPREYRWACLQK